MKINFENKGPIEKFEYDLKGITVIAGENGSGKTTNLNLVFQEFDVYHKMINILGNIISNKDQRITSYALLFIKPLINTIILMENNPIEIQNYIQNNVINISNQIINQFTEYTKNNDTITNFSNEELLVYIIELLNQLIEEFKGLSIGIYNRVVYIPDTKTFESNALWLYEPDTTSTTKEYIKLPKNKNVDKDLVKKLNDIYFNATKIYKEENNYVDQFKNRVSYEGLSAGFRSFTLLLNLVERVNFNANTILAIDESENHLQPFLQLEYCKMLVLLAKYSGCTILLNTHSPYIVSAIDAYCDIFEYDKLNCYITMPSYNGYVLEENSDNIELLLEKLSEPFDKIADLLENLEV